MITTAALWDDAKQQADVADTELRRRLAIDAMYYAVYLSVRRRVGTQRASNPFGEHVAVIENLQKLGPSERRAGLRLDSLRDLRNKARYSIGLPMTREELTSARRHAENIIGLLPTLFDAAQ